jgi:hypothetical protein
MRVGGVTVLSPRLARKEYFLSVLNEPESVHAQWIATHGPLAREMYDLLTNLAEHVRDNTTCSSQELARLNDVFDSYSPVRLHVDTPDQSDEPLWTQASRSPLGGATVRAVLGSHPSQPPGNRVYFEALVSLLEALEEGPLELGRCAECQTWFVPYSRAPVTKFCSARCRNRANYRARRGTASIK